ncbi:hypothetical protein ACW9HC_13770 [Nocardia gipuzkoensis]
MGGRLDGWTIHIVDGDRAHFDEAPTDVTARTTPALTGAAGTMVSTIPTSPTTPACWAAAIC